MGKIKCSKFKVDSYYFTVHVEIVASSKEVGERYKQLAKKYEQKEDNTPCLGTVVTHGFVSHLILSENDLCYDLITHENSHLTFNILNANNIYSGEDNEHFALLNGYINSNVFNIILSKKCKIQTTYPKILPVSQP